MPQPEAELKPITFEQAATAAQPPVIPAIKTNGVETVKVDVDEKLKPEAKVDDSKPPVEKTEPIVDKEKKEKKANFRKKAESFFDKTETGKTVGEINKEKELPAEIQAKLKKLDDPNVQAAIEAFDSGKDFFGWVDDIRGVDASKMTPEQIFEHDLRNLGTSEEELADAMADFSAKPNWQKKKETENLYQKYSADKVQLLDKFKERARAEKIAQTKALETTQKNYEALVENSVGQKVWGMTIEPEMATELKRYFDKNPLIPQKADGSLDETALLEVVILRKYKDLIIDNLETNAVAEGAEEILDLVEATKSPSSSSQRSSEVPGKIVAPQDKEKAHLDNLVPVTYSQLTGR